VSNENAVKLDSEQGKQTIDALMAKMDPEQKAIFEAALKENKPLHVHMDKDGRVLLGDAADAATGDVIPGASEAPVEVKADEPAKPKKLSKLDEKRQRIFQERMQRHMGKGLTQEQAFRAIQKEDYDALPLDKKFQRLEHMVSSALQNFAEEIMNLSQGQNAIGDAFDINYRAISKMFEKVGLPLKDHAEFMKLAQEEHIEVRKKAIEAQQAAQKAAMESQQAEAKKAQETSEGATIEKELKAAESKKIVGGEAPPESTLPTEATVFGG